MTAQATGPFEIKMAPLDTYNQAEGAGIARFSIDKEYSGDIEATSQGEMVSAGSPQEGRAGYVAMERVTGTLAGRQGSFVLQHSSTMDGDRQSQSIAVVPGTTTGELTGLTGTMRILNEAGAHSYEFDYSLSEPA